MSWGREGPEVPGKWKPQMQGRCRARCKVQNQGSGTPVGRGWATPPVGAIVQVLWWAWANGALGC